MKRNTPTVPLTRDLFRKLHDQQSRQATRARGVILNGKPFVILTRGGKA